MGKNNFGRIRAQMERIDRARDRRGVLGEYGTGDADFDEKMLELTSKRPREENFISVYGIEEVNRDLQEVERIKESPWYQKERPEKATIVESVIAYGIAKRDWLGKGAKVYLTSKYDDFKRGVDMLVEVPHPDSPPDKRISLGLVIDVTASPDIDVIEKKLLIQFNV